MTRTQTLFLILVAGFCSGSLYPLIKIADDNSIPKFAYIFWESLIICMVTAIWSLRNGRKDLFKIREIPYYLFCAFTNILIPQYIAFNIAGHIPASWVSITNILTPAFVYIGLVLFFRERFEKTKAAGLLMGLLGTGLLFLISLFNITRPDTWMWLWISLLMPLDYAVNRIYANRLRPMNAPNHRLIFGFFSFVTLISGVMMFATHRLYAPFIDYSPGDLALLAHAFLLTVFYVIFFILTKTDAVQSSLSFYVAPLTGILWGVVFFNDDINFIYIIAALFIFYGLYLVNKKRVLPPEIENTAS